MKVNELMVGDWVYVSGKPVKITKDDLATMLIFLDDDSKISPIPLTENILVKNGFSYEEDTFLPDTGYWSLSDEDGLLYLTINAFGVKGSGEVAFGYQDIALNYVHQLQRLLNLCDIDKEIIL